MKNKYIILIISIISLIFGFLILKFNNNYIQKYDYNYNILMSNIINTIKSEYPDIDEEKIIEILNEEDIKEDTFLRQYGIDITSSSISLKNQQVINKMLVIDALIIFFYFLLILTMYLLYNHHINKQIINITKYVEEINKKNYKLDIISNGENSLSLLQNEIYKTMVMLKEAADNSLSDKEQLKDSLSDISHQLKTPLTSISIMLDNIIDDINMEPSIREDFILDIKREIMNINFLVQNILKLSKFDANTIKFASENIDVSKLLDEVVKNVSVLSDLKNVSIGIDCPKNIKIKVDFKWEVEALTNILKNSIEHAYEETKVTIKVLDNRIYKTISIANEGNNISKKDIKHIFERFYKGENSSKDSVGIGLSLAKMIIEKDNGNISVESKNNKTEFKVKYFN